MSTPPTFLGDGGEMGDRILGFDWSRTPVGAIDAWSQALRTAVSLCVTSRHPMALTWGSDYTILYNDAYRPILGPTKHPGALGRSARDAWSEIWGTIGPMLKGVYTSGRPTWSENMPLRMSRHLPHEDTSFTFSYSPIHDDDGRIAGVLCVCSETTSEVVRRRRLEVLYALASRTAQATSTEGACVDAAEVLAGDPADIPFALFYVRDPVAPIARLAAATGVAPGTTPAPAEVALDAVATTGGWQLAAVDATRRCVLVDGLAAGADDACDGALVVPVAASGAEPPAAFLVAGLSPHQVHDREYETFLELVASQLTAAVANARMRRGERELAHAVVLLNTLYDAAPVGLSYVDANLRHVHMNERLAHMFDLDAGAAIGRSIQELLPEEGARWLSAQVQQVLSTGRPLLNVETHLEGPEGRRYWLENFYPVRRGGAEPPGVGIAVIEITDRKRAEQERERLLARAEAAREQAEEASRLKDEFLATVSHELRTPLNAIIGWARLLRGGRLASDQQTRAVETIDRNAKAQTQLIEDLLDVSRIIAGKLRLEVQDVPDLHLIIERAIDSIRPAAQAKDIRVTAILDPTAGLVRGDPDRLQQIAWNLLSNAIKFTPKGGRVQVRMARRDSNVEITVADTGPGIEAAFLPYVFDRFRQADGRTTRAHGGLGLGLAISRHLVELHGGTIAVESRSTGEGAVFNIALPIATVDTWVPYLLDEGSGELPAAGTLAGITVLAVDDEPDTLEVLRTILEDFGAEVRTAASARAALDAIAQAPPHVLISDIGMAGDDGYALIREVRRLPPERGGRVPAVALTAYARIQDRLKVLSSGFQMHIAKPVEPAELVTVVASIAHPR